MLNTHKLLYILPDVAYIAELLPAKKEHTFSVQAFRQINGEFLTDEDDLIPENIEKLLSKIEAETYHLILPDFLFTNTILEIKETQEAKVKQYIKETLLPSLELSKETHEIETFVLTQYNNVTKIQLTALEKSVVAPVAQSAANHGITIDKISPLSWTIKSVISLEPSISVIQIGSILYTAEHYIGVDQCTMAKVEEIENVGDTIKTLKGAQPSIQTIYLMTNNLVEDKLKELVSSTLPIQQLASYKEDDAQLPSYVKHIIESSMRTLDITDYPVPTFALPKVDPQAAGTAAVDKPRPLNVFGDETETIEPEDTTKKETEAEDPSESEKVTADDRVESSPFDEELPAPTPLPITEPVESVSTVVSQTSETAITSTVTTDDLDDDDDEEGELEVIEAVIKEEAKEEDESTMATNEFPSQDIAIPEREVDGPTLSAITSPPVEGKNELMSEKAPQPESPAKPVVIKNRAGNGAWVKMLFIMISVFVLTVAVGMGIGFAVLKITDQNFGTATPSPSPSPLASVSPSPVVSPSPSPQATVNKEDLSILIVNATTKAGYAGGTRTKLDEAGYGSVQAANARGDYEPGIYVLMKDENSALIDTLASDSDLELQFAEGIETEDPRDQYDAVIVLAE